MGIEVVSPLDCPTLAAPFFNLLVVERISRPIIISAERHVTTPVPLYRASGGGTASSLAVQQRVQQRRRLPV